MRSRSYPSLGSTSSKASLRAHMRMRAQVGALAAGCSLRSTHSGRGRDRRRALVDATRIRAERPPNGHDGSSVCCGNTGAGRSLVCGCVEKRCVVCAHNPHVPQTQMPKVHVHVPRRYRDAGGAPAGGVSTPPCSRPRNLRRKIISIWIEASHTRGQPAAGVS